MANRYLVSELLEALRDTGMLPTSDESFTTERLIAVMNREQRLYLSRLLVGLGEGYQQGTATVALVAGQTRYRVPSRAIVAGLKLVEYVTEGGAVPLDAIPRERVHNQEVYGAGGDYFLEGHELVLLHAPAAGGSLRFTYLRRLNELVPVDAVGEIIAIDAAARQVTVSGLPTTFTNSARYDLVQGSPHFDTLGADLTATIIASVLTFTEKLPSELTKGDFVCLAGQTPICQAPLELHDVLVQKACVTVLQAKGDPKAGAAIETLRQMREDAIALLQPRVKSRPELVINYSAPGWHRSRRR